MILTSKQAIVLRLRKRGMPCNEIARQLRIRPESVSRLTSRAHARIFKFLRACPGEAPRFDQVLDACL